MEYNVNEILESGIEYIDRLKIELPLRINNYRKGNMETLNFDDLNFLIEGIEWLITVIEKINFNKDNEKINFNSVLRELLKAIQDKDSTLIADILEYEILDIFEKIKSVFQDDLKLRSQK